MRQFYTTILYYNFKNCRINSYDSFIRQFCTTDPIRHAPVVLLAVVVVLLESTVTQLHFNLPTGAYLLLVECQLHFQHCAYENWIQTQMCFLATAW